MSTRTILGGAASALLIGILSFGLAASLQADSDGGAGKLRDVAPSGAARTSQNANVTISIVVYPPARASVSWGRKRLGLIKPREALVVKRPRDSGPLDLMIRAQGYLPVQTRAYTFNDGKLEVRLTPVDQVSTLLGYREPVDAGVDGGQLDAGVGYGYSSDAGVRGQ
jgi:hypothetical protein